jgi:hypothetical protein
MFCDVEVSLIEVLRYVSLTLPSIISSFESGAPLLGGISIGVDVLVGCSSKRPSISEFAGDSIKPSIGLDELVGYPKSSSIAESEHESVADGEGVAWTVECDPLEVSKGSPVRSVANFE